ncbi:MAG: hypothetical protein NTV34_08830 [Proteobacteria bacterium]|nr:hypothetical protein [Pseudomonadota bacterium]
MSRILEFHPSDEQTIVARVLLELHQEIDLHFPDTKGSSRQFTKTVLSSNSESTAIDQQPGQPSPIVTQITAPRSSSPALEKPLEKPQEKPLKKPRNAVAPDRGDSHPQSGLQFSAAASSVSNLENTRPNPPGWSKWLTGFLIVSLLTGTALIAWIYLFGFPNILGVIQ